MRFNREGFMVTGGGSGIGQQVCFAAAKDGANVAVVDIDMGNAVETAEEIRRRSGSAQPYQLDVTNAEAVTDVVNLITEQFGTIDVLVNSAGVREIAPVLELDCEDWNRVLGVNLSGTFFASQAVARAAVAAERPARIVNLASTLGIVAAPNRAAYTASKHGVVGLTKQMALELGDKGIRVNAVAPGVTRTPMTEECFDGGEYESIIKSIHAVGRVGAPEEIANAILFLAQSDNGFITGAVLTVDGGWTTGKKY